MLINLSFLTFSNQVRIYQTHWHHYLYLCCVCEVGNRIIRSKPFIRLCDRMTITRANLQRFHTTVHMRYKHASQTKQMLLFSFRLDIWMEFSVLDEYYLRYNADCLFFNEHTNIKVHTFYYIFHINSSYYLDMNYNVTNFRPYVQHV